MAKTENFLDCLHCYEDVGIEYLPAAMTWWCTSCGAHWHYLALNDTHYFNNGEVHHKEEDICIGTTIVAKY